jgi:hypothetical protein
LKYLQPSAFALLGVTSFPQGKQSEPPREGRRFVIKHDPSSVTPPIVGEQDAIMRRRQKLLLGTGTIGALLINALPVTDPGEHEPTAVGSHRGVLY